MFGQQYYYALLKKHLVAFGYLFADTYIARTDTQGNITQYLKVPLTYAGKDKMLATIQQGYQDKLAQVDLPIMSFEMTGLTWRQDGKLNTLNRVVKESDDPDKFNYMYQSVPYDIGWRLSIWVKNREDGLKILDGIIPNFQPEYTLPLNLIPEMGLVIQDTPVILNGINYSDSYDGAMTTQNPIIWSLDFTMQANLWGVTKTKPIIKRAKQIFYFGGPGNDNEPIGELDVTPGLLANGQPTTNSAASVNIHTISVTDDYGFSVDTFGMQGVYFNGNTGL